MDAATIRESFMFGVLDRLVSEDTLGRGDSYLLVFAGEFDQAVVSELGLDNAVLTNLNPEELAFAEVPGDGVADATRLPHGDQSFDHVLAHAGLHHTARPHQAVCEMYRVARRTVTFFESQDSPSMRLAVALGFADRYEINANLLRGGGGGDAARFPNHVYRWTRREVEKLVRSLEPAYEPAIELHREWRIAPHVERVLRRGPLRLIPRRVRRVIAQTTNAAVNVVAGSHSNSMAVVIRKDQRRLQPWMAERDGEVVMDLGAAEARWRGRHT